MTTSKEELDRREAQISKNLAEVRAKRRADPKQWAARKNPILREDLDATSDAFLHLLATTLFMERDFTEARLKGLDGRTALLGAGRTVAQANVASIIRAVEPVTQRRAILTEGHAPRWAAPLFSAGGVQ